MCSCGRFHRRLGAGNGDGINDEEGMEEGEGGERATGVAGMCCCTAGRRNGGARVGGLASTGDRGGVVSTHPIDRKNPLRQLKNNNNNHNNHNNNNNSKSNNNNNNNNNNSEMTKAGSDRKAIGKTSNNNNNRKPLSNTSDNSSSSSNGSGNSTTNNGTNNRSDRSGNSTPWWRWFDRSRSGSGMLSYHTATTPSRSRPMSEYELVQSCTDSLSLSDGDNLDDEELEVNELGDEEEHVVVFRSSTMVHHRS